MMIRICVFLAVLATLCASALAADDIVIADFEGTDYGNWTTTGEAFGSGPAQGTLPNQQHVDGYQGHGLVNSFLGGDAARGTLTSPDSPSIAIISASSSAADIIPAPPA